MYSTLAENMIHIYWSQPYQLNRNNNETLKYTTMKTITKLFFLVIATLLLSATTSFAQFKAGSRMNIDI